MFIEYLKNTLTLLIISYFFLYFFPRLRASLKKTLAKMLLSAYFSDGLWLKRKNSLNQGDNVELVHLMLIDGEFVVTRSTQSIDVLSVDTLEITESPHSKVPVPKKIILPRQIN